MTLSDLEAMPKAQRYVRYIGPDRSGNGQSARVVGIDRGPFYQGNPEKGQKDLSIALAFASGQRLRCGVDELEPLEVSE